MSARMEKTGSAELPIVFEDVYVSAGSTPILRGISLRITAGAPTVFIGPNGSGKTTLLRAAMGLVRPVAGTITHAGQAGTSPARRALVFQRPVMLRRSVAANVHYALATADVPRALRSARVAELLTLVGLQELAERPAPRLSGGERQRLALARALARDPAVLFLDEPTASLDPAATLAIEELVRTVSARGVKVVMTTHDLGEAARLAGEVVLLHRGEIVESGPAQQVLANPATELARRFIAGQLLI
jgi:tungstate transport system ATP-binding protein